MASMEMSSEEYLAQRITPARLRAKYGNQKTEVEGVVFASRAESRRFEELKLLELAGEISDLRVQPTYELQKGFVHKGKKVRAATYRADFSYVEHGVEVAEDVKAFDRRTGKFLTTPLFDLKLKLLMFTHPALVFRLVEA